MARPPRYFALSDNIFLREANVVFQLNGKAGPQVGKSCLRRITSNLRLRTTSPAALDDFVPRNIQDFLTDLVLGNSSDAAPPPGR